LLLLIEHGGGNATRHAGRAVRASISSGVTAYAGHSDQAANLPRKKVSADQKSFLAFIKQINLDKDAVMKAQRIGTLPDGELEKATSSRLTRARA